MTARDVIKGALRLLGVHQPGEEPTASEASDGLEALNQMLHEWPLDLQHEDLALTDDLRVPPDHLRAIRYNLAIEIAPEYGRQVSQEVAVIADESKRNLQSEYANPARLNTQQFGDRRYDIHRDT